MITLNDASVADFQLATASTARHWLAALLLRRESAAATRFAHHYQRLSHLPRRMRRLLRRRMALTVAGAALLLALGSNLTGISEPGRSYAGAANITVANSAVDVDPEDELCALTEAIANANNNVSGNSHADCAPGNPHGADTIVLPPGGDFPLQENLDQKYSNFLGLPMISSEVTIIGNGATIRQSPAADFPLNLLTVSPHGNLTVNNVVFADGQSSGSDGAAIHALGPTIVRDSTFVNNIGAAIHAEFTALTVERSQFSGNSGDFGSAISSYHADVTLNDSIITGGRAMSGAVFVDRGVVDINGTVFADNYNLGGPFGGTLVLASTPNAAIRHSRFTNNVTGNPNGPGFKDATGGAITMENNISYVEMQVEISQSILSGNIAGAGGGIYMTGGEVTVRETTINGNQAIYGGGILSKGGKVLLENCTISGNKAFSVVPTEGEVYGGNGGGLIVEPYLLTIRNSTIAANVADNAGGGIWTIGVWPDSFFAERVLITGNAAPLGPQMAIAYFGNPLDGGFNLFGANGDPGVYGFEPGPTDIVPAAGVTVAQIINPTLYPIFDSTPLHILPLGSPAIDAAPSADCAGQTDQRGFTRNLNGDGVPSANECDIGAFERGPIVDNWAFLPITQR